MHRDPEDRTPKLVGDEPEKAVAWYESQKLAWRAGLGDASVDGTDEDMVDAAVLAMSDGMGGTLWRPARLDDIHDLPYRTLHLFMALRAGARDRNEPWKWWAAGRVQHQYRVTYEGYPDDKARCGSPKVDGMTQNENATQCTACERLSKGEPASFGAIGD